MDRKEFELLEKRIANILKITSLGIDLSIGQIEQVLYLQDCGFLAQDCSIGDIKRIMDVKPPDTHDVRTAVWGLIAQQTAKFTPRKGVVLVY